MTEITGTPQGLQRPRVNRKTAGLVLLAVAFLAFAFLKPASAWAAISFAAYSLVLVSPMILIGIALTAGITASGSMAVISAAFKGRELRMIMVASLIGALTPVCGVTVLPLVAGLLAARVPFAPIMAFWLSSPVTDPGMLAITAGTLGAEFALGKTLGAFAAGILGGGVTLVLTGFGRLANPTRVSLADYAAQSACDRSSPDRIVWRFWREAERRRIFARTAIATGRLMLTWLTAAFVAEYFLRDLLPPELLSRYVGADNSFAVPIAAVIGAPIYLDGYAALPLVRGLIESGMAPGAAMTFLISGGTISAYAAIPVFALVRLPVFCLYVVLAILSAMLAGWGFELMLHLLA